MSWIWVSRDEVGDITGVYQVAQPTFAGELIRSTDPAVIAFLEGVVRKEVVNCGIIRFTVAANTISTTDDTIGVGGVTRVSAGRYRIYYSAPDDNLTILASVDIRDAVDVRGRVSNKTSSFVEVRVVNAAGTATDAAEVTVKMDKII